ncbi:CAP domain-containing protein [Oryzibacter oryziterrae]|uniref:CAP domain-containing protein n=1 Tax=Oryzibacter oryziterrae TaxID=2766474 RepID=UPI001F274C84|nr:CAP domain-containing protein [Oryzibacter oryziterrae]
MSYRALLLAAAAALSLAACQSEPPPSPKPSFYEDLASPTAQIDQRKMLEMINQYRAQSGIAPLQLDPRLSQIAADYARKMAALDDHGHNVDGHSMLGDRLKSYGYAFANAGENVAAGYHTIAEAFSGWRQSPPHDRGMKDPEMTLMGIGTAYNPNSKYKVFWSLIFAHPPITPPGAPVAAAVMPVTPGKTTVTFGGAVVN